MTEEEIFAALTSPQGRRVLIALTALYIGLTLAGNVPVSQAFAERWPRLAMLFVLGQKWGAVVRGALKPIVGLVLPSVAKQVLDEIFPGAFSGRTLPPPPSNGGTPS